MMLKSSQAEDTFQELENLHKKLQQGRDEVVRLDAEQAMVKREVEIARGQWEDTSALSGVEQLNLQAMCGRFHNFQREYGETEAQVAATHAGRGDGCKEARCRNIPEQSTARSR
jgi:hypothetical protein